MDLKLANDKNVPYGFALGVCIGSGDLQCSDDW